MALVIASDPRIDGGRRRRRRPLRRHAAPARRDRPHRPAARAAPAAAALRARRARPARHRGAARHSRSASRSRSSTRRLPRAGGAARPRILLELAQKEHTLSVLPTLVYGDPPEARIEDGKLVHLGGRVPPRDEPAERALLARLRDELNLVPGRRVDFDGTDAIRFAQKLRAWKGGGAEAAARELFGKGRLVPRLAHRRRRASTSSSSSTPRARTRRRGDAAADSAPTPRAVLRAWQDGLAARAARRRRLGAAARRLARRSTARASPICSPRGATTARSRPPRSPRSPSSATRSSTRAPPSFARLAPLLEGFERIPEAPLPADLTADAAPLPAPGRDWLAFLRDAGLGAVLADDMGLGKTLQTLCALRGRTLVVCPRSVVHNWADEIARFRPALRVGDLPRARGARSIPTADVTLTTYAVLRLDAEALAAEAWDTVVLDEAQAIKNPDSQVARAAFELRGRLPRRAHRHAGREPPRRAVEPAALHEPRPARRPRRLPGALRAARSPPATPGAAARLRAQIRPFVLRRLKRDVAPELPPRTDAVLHFELDEQRAQRLRRRARRHAEGRRRAASPRAASVLAALEALLRLRQAACHPALVPGQHADDVVEGRAPARGARGRRRRRAQGARLLAVDVAARSRRAAPRATPGIALHAPRRLDARSRRRGRRVPGRRRARR